MNKTIHKIDDLAFPIRLIQTGLDSFTVLYGEQSRTGLTYAKAAQEYGASIMHALACGGLLLNSND